MVSGKGREDLCANSVSAWHAWKLSLEKIPAVLLLVVVMLTAE
jgi:hypothetical protein